LSQARSVAAAAATAALVARKGAAADNLAFLTMEGLRLARVEQEAEDAHVAAAEDVARTVAAAAQKQRETAKRIAAVEATMIAEAAHPQHGHRDSTPLLVVRVQTRINTTCF
jgi:hypothetical protein